MFVTKSAERDAHYEANLELVKKYLLEGRNNASIAKAIGLSTRGIKRYFSVLFHQYGITDGIKRIKLAVVLYHEREK